MMDLIEKESELENMNICKNPDGISSEESQAKKICADCGTSKTPLWRGGPAGPKSLCNACGIRSRKKRGDLLGLNKTVEKKMKKGSNSSSSGSSSTSTSTNNSKNKKFGDSLKRRLMALGREVLLQRSKVQKERRKLGEEEQAALLLMALSYGSTVYA